MATKTKKPRPSPRASSPLTGKSVQSFIDANPAHAFLKRAEKLGRAREAALAFGLRLLISMDEELRGQMLLWERDAARRART
jgi:hypothetical protein